MKEKPILFSTPMVQAILDGRKTQTRRALKLERFGPSTTLGYLWHFIKKGRWFDVNDIVKYCPYGQIGDVLWVRETFMLRPNGQFNFFGQDIGKYIYYASESKQYKSEWKGNWKPSIHMPREACRLFLEITNIRVERLQNITSGDAMCEGITWDIGQEWICEQGIGNAYAAGFKKLWQSINGSESWQSNPFVWVIEFKRIER